MNVEQLLNNLRLKLVTLGVIPPVDEALLVLLNNAYFHFVNEMGGIYDQEVVYLSPGDTEFVIPSYVLKLKSGNLLNGDEVTIINQADVDGTNFNDIFGKAGGVKYVLIGEVDGYAKIAYSPVEDEEITFNVDRLPKRELVNPTDKPLGIPDMFHSDMIMLAVADVALMNQNPAIRALAPVFESEGMAKAIKASSVKSRKQSKQYRETAYGGI